MAIPSGGGTEVLKRAYKTANSDNWETMITGVANHIYTILSVSFADQNDTVHDCRIKIDISGGGTDIYLLSFQTLPVKGVFTYNDKFVITGTDQLKCYNSAGNVDIYVSYIEQDFS